ncbi:MAG: hypothetical protein K8U03_07165 [Planctomycetia bacterium]|nr:hypothetical protein [Planctomycetia bacterium]
MLAANAVEIPADAFPAPVAAVPPPQAPAIQPHALEGPSFFDASGRSSVVVVGDAAELSKDLDGPIRLPQANPSVLRAPDEPDSLPPADGLSLTPEWDPFFQYSRNMPAGFTGRSGVAPREGQQSPHFVPLEDRWRIGVPEWDRYGKGHPITDDYPYDLGRLLNPYKQNVLKGDYPIVGQHTFLNITVANVTLAEVRQVPTPQNAFEVTQNPNSFDQFGNPNQTFITNNTIFTADLSHGDSSFKPADWRIRVTSVFNENYLDVKELGIIGPDVEEGRVRYRTDIALQEWFVETKLADLSADYDFMSLRVGSQPFVSDFRGFVFADTNRGVRLFGTRHANREQFNLAYFSQLEKQTNSFLNTWDNRKQDVIVANYFRQDTFVPGYTALLNFHFVHDAPSTHFDADGFLVRPDPAGVFQEHQVNAAYLGWGGDGHIGRINITHQFYQVFGHDSLNPIGGQPVTVNSQMAAIELSRDFDWLRIRGSYFYASGEDDPFSRTAHGFDTILDNPNFAGGQFSYWQRQGPRIFGVALTNRNSLIPDLRSSRLEGQPNYMNPGVHILNGGFDIELTQKLRLIQNTNLLWFDATGVLKQFLFQSQVQDFIGTDISLGAEYRPLLSNNIIFVAGAATLVPGGGLRDIYNNVTGPVSSLYSIFCEMTLLY